MTLIPEEHEIMRKSYAGTEYADRSAGAWHAAGQHKPCLVVNRSFAGNLMID